MGDVKTYPKRVRVGSGGVFDYRPDLYSVRSAHATPAPDAVAIISEENGHSFAVYKGPRPPSRSAEKTGPVYSAGPGGPLAVPTGRVFIRLSEGVRPDQLRDRIEAAGFRIVQTPSYAPNAAWLEPGNAGVGPVLTGLASLEALDDVVHVEPQLLLSRSFKE